MVTFYDTNQHIFRKLSTWMILTCISAFVMDQSFCSSPLSALPRFIMPPFMLSAPASKTILIEWIFKHNTWFQLGLYSCFRICFLNICDRTLVLLYRYEESFTIKEGNSLNVTCWVQSYPLSHITWTKCGSGTELSYEVNLDIQKNKK